MHNENFPHSRLRRRLMAAAVLGMLALPLRAAPAFAEITWEDLVPEDWDPMAEFADVKDLDALPDSDPRVIELYERLRHVWDSAPVVSAMAGRAVKLPGYLVPLDETKAGLREFLLVPYFGACIHTPPPPANQIIHVRAATPIKGLRTMDAVWASGTLELKRSDSAMGSSGYSMAAKSVVRYKEPRR